MTVKSQITAQSERKKSTPKSAWKPGQSGNPGGRPKNQKSITHWVNEFGNQSPAALSAELKQYAAQLKQVKGDLPIFGHIAIRTLMALINEPDARLLAQVLDRTEGKVSQPVEVYDWRKELEANGYDASAAFERLVAAIAASPRPDDGRSDGGGEEPHT